MPSKSVKDLYIAKSWEELSKRAEDVNQKITITTNPQNVIKSADKLYSAAKEADLVGDEERCYILFFRYFEVITNIKKTNDYKKDKEYYQKLIGVFKVKEAFDHLELLTTSLKKRYSALQESLEIRAKEIANLNETSGNQSINNCKQLEVNDDSYPLIDCQSLIEELENGTEMTRISIFDTREENEFNDSHIDKIKTSVDLSIVNVPKEYLTPGITANKLHQILPLGTTKDVFDRRRQMSKIIILDKFSDEMISSTPAFNLAEALWKWDSTSLKVKNKPFLLKGGYKEWLLIYPMYSSNPIHVLNTNTLINRKRLDLSFNYELNELENEPKKVDNPLVNGLSNGQITEEQESEDSKSRNEIFQPMFQSRPSNAAIPGSAQLATNLPSIPDRSTKPKIQIERKNSTEKTIETKEDFEKFKLRKQNELSEDMIDLLRNEYTKDIQTYNEELKRKDEENATLKIALRQLLPKKPEFIPNEDTNNERPHKTPKIITNGEIYTEDKRNGIYLNLDEKVDDKENELNENHIRNSISMNGDIRNPIPNGMTPSAKNINKSSNTLSVNSNLSRSMSSPNIAQLLEKEISTENERHYGFNKSDSKERSLLNASQPQFDRTLKPSLTRMSFNDNKIRDFCPVHSAGSSITGLRNLGNTCFMNAVIQCLLNTTEFSNFFTTGIFHINKSSKFGSNGELVLELMALFRAMAYPSSYKSISPKDFKQAVSKHIQGFIGCSQQDSHEFLVMLIEKLHADLNESTARDMIDTSVSEELSLSAAANKFWKEHLNKNKSIITELFEGLIVNTLTCLTCHKSSNAFEVFRCLSLPLNNYRTNLNECLNQFLKSERLFGEASWLCPTCQTKREAEKKVIIWKLPKVLIVHLKRFLYEGVYNWRQKNQTYVEFPIEELSVRSLNSETKYNLYGVVNHYGTLEGGHYTAFSTNRNHYKWHRFDDQEITQMSAADVKTQSAYILFYKCC